jgi:hypothetical protein
VVTEPRVGNNGTERGDTYFAPSLAAKEANAEDWKGGGINERTEHITKE